VRRLAAAGLAMAVAACSAAPPPATAPPPVASALPAPSPPPSPRPAADACGAAALQGLVGHLRSDIPVPVRPDLQRVACATCPVSEDYNPNRLNFLFDAETGRITAVRCG